MPTTGRASDRGDDTASEIEHRLAGDLNALSDFARELSQLRDRPASESDLQKSLAAVDKDSKRTGYASGRINADPNTVEQSLAKLVLTLIEFIRQLLEKQAIRRMEAGSLSDDEIERMGETFLKLEQRMIELKATFGLQDEELNLSLGPLGNLLPEE